MILGNECLELSSRPKTTTFFVESSKDDSTLLTCKNRIEWSHTVRIFLVDEQTKYERFFVRSSMVLEKRGTISEEENRLFFSSFCMTKRKIFCPFYFYKMGRWRLRKANRHNPKGIKGESETSPFSSHIVIQERSALYYNVIACSIYGFIWSILLWGL